MRSAYCLQLALPMMFALLLHAIIRVNLWQLHLAVLLEDLVDLPQDSSY
jgi:hypothetical protein